MAEKIKHLETNYIKQSELNFIIILNNDDEVKKFNELTKEKLTRPCIITINNGCVCTSNLAELSFYQDLGFIPLEIKKSRTVIEEGESTRTLQEKLIGLTNTM